MKYLYHVTHVKGKRLIVYRNINPFKGYMKLVSNLSGGNQIYTRMKWYENKVNLNSSIIRISHQRCYVSVSDKSAGLQACWPTQVFSVNVVEFARIPYVQKISGRLNLYTLTARKISKYRKNTDQEKYRI